MVPTAPTASGERRALILTVTRRCDLRCAYCPTVKDGLPDLSAADAVSAVHGFADRFRGDMKLFGGEPLLVPHVVDAAIEAANGRPEIERIYLSTNATRLDRTRVERVRDEGKLILTVSIDGPADAQRRFRRGEADPWAPIDALRDVLVASPRVVVTMTIPPAAAEGADERFAALLAMGFRRFNLLPGYYLPWREDQLAALRASFDGIGAIVRSEWAAGRVLYLRNLFTMAPLPFFNAGLVVDVDRGIYAANLLLSGKLEAAAARTRLGDLDAWPAPGAVDAGIADAGRVLEELVPAALMVATRRADAELTRLVAGLLPIWLRVRANRALPRTA